MKVLSVVEKTYQKDGETKKLWRAMLEKLDGPDIEAVTWSEIKKGDDIPDEKVQPDGKGGFIIKSDRKDKKPYFRNDELNVAECAMKLVVDCALGGLIDPPLTSQKLLDNGMMFGRAIIDVSHNLKDDRGRVETKSDNGITTSKLLFTKVQELGLSVQDCQKISGFTHAVNCGEYGQAYELAWAATGAQKC